MSTMLDPRRPGTVTARRSLLRIAPQAAAALALTTAPTAQAQPNARQRPEIIRTEHGVPHIYAADYWAGGYGLAWVELEDYGPRIVMALVAARGEMGLAFGRDSVEQDVSRRPIHARAKEVWPRLEPETRQMYEGFATAVNDYLATKRGLVPAGVSGSFIGPDVLAREMSGPDLAGARRLVNGRPGPPVMTARGDGSNAWALGPSRTTSGKAILLRNPHLDWDQGYYEAHLVIADALEFYGDFRIGTVFGVVGGFNADLGWATTNNATDLDEVYSIPLTRGRDDRLLLDGKPVPIVRSVMTVPYRSDTGRAFLTRETWRSPLGPVIERRNGRAFVLKTAGEGEFRGGEQFLKMMRARSLAEWKAAMKIRARPTSNFTYADRAGNIFYVWNGNVPALPHRPGRDSAAIAVTSRRQIFSRVIPWDSLPQVENPSSGYLHNENDSPHYTNLEQILDSNRFAPNVERPALRLRSQLSIDLIGHPEDRFSLDDLVREKHSYRMLLAERVLPDLLRAVRAQQPVTAPAALRVLDDWDRTGAATSRGAVLFEAWWRLYAKAVKQPFEVDWTPADPIRTPRGIANPVLAGATLKQAADSVERRHGRLDVAWGEVHRIRLGAHDLPVGGCPGDLGCFRVLWFKDEPDGKRAVQGGDAWVLAVEFGDVPRAYSVLAYGQSNQPDSPYFADQADRFARGDLKPVAWRRADVERQAIRRYRAGSPPRQ